MRDWCQIDAARHGRGPTKTRDRRFGRAKMALGRLPVSPQPPRSANSRNSKPAMAGLSKPAKPGLPAASAQVSSGNSGRQSSVRIGAGLPGM